MTTAAHDRLPIPGCPGTRKKAEINETAYGTWVGYSGGARIWLALVLVAVAAGLTYLGVRLRLPMRPIRPGRAVATFMLVTWVLSIVTFLVCATAYAEQIRQLKLLGAAPANPITTVTFTAAALLFVIISALGRAQGLKVAVTGAAIGAMAAPLIFELPFDLIVMARTYPPIPPYPGLYRALFFLPLFLVEISTLALLTMSSMVALTRGPSSPWRSCSSYSRSGPSPGSSTRPRLSPSASTRCRRSWPSSPHSPCSCNPTPGRPCNSLCAVKEANRCRKPMRCDQPIPAKVTMESEVR